MITFAELLRTVPTIASPIEARLRSTGLGVLGTIRSDGSPRVSPIEVSLQDHRLYVGMMPGSRKLADVRRDARVMLLTPLADRTDMAGEGKLAGHLIEVTDPAESARVLNAAADAAGLDAEALAGSPMFELVVHTAAWQFAEDDVFATMSWRLADGAVVRRRERSGATGLPIDVADVSGDASNG
jgi:hypothetical protein